MRSRVWSIGRVGSERTPPPARLRLNCREAEEQMAGDCALATRSLLISCSTIAVVSKKRVCDPESATAELRLSGHKFHAWRVPSASALSRRHSATETPVSGLYHCRWSRQAKERLSRSSVPACGDVMPRLVIRSMHDFNSQKPTVAQLA
jgi:hypothetical protein